MEKMFIVFLVLLPFVVWNGSFEGPKVLLFLVMGLTLCLFWIFRILIKREYLKFNKSDYFFLVWILALLLSSIFGVHPLESVMGGSYRHQGVLFFLSLWLMKKTVDTLNPGNKKLLHKSIGVAILVQSLIVFIQFALGRTYFGKPLGTIGEANAIAGFLAIGSVFIFENFGLYLLLPPVVAILLTTSRSGLLSFLPNTLFIFNNFSRKWVKIVLISLCLITSSSFLFFVSNQKTPSLFEDRVLIWDLGVRQFMGKPLLGFGAESGEVVYAKAFNEFRLPLEGLIVDRAHNLFLDVGIWSGAFGIMTFLIFLYFYFKNIEKKSHKFAFFSFLFYSTFQPLSIVHWLLFFLL